MKIGNGRGRYRWSCRRESLVDFEWTKRIDKIYIWNTGNARESVKFIVGEGRFLKKMKFEGWQTQIWDRNRGTNCNSYFVGESQIAEVHLRFHYRSFVKRNWLCVVRASSKVIGIRKRRKALLLCSRFIIEIKSIVRLSNKENRKIDRSISSFFFSFFFFFFRVQFVQDEIRTIPRRIIIIIRHFNPYWSCVPIESHERFPRYTPLIFATWASWVRRVACKLLRLLLECSVN